MKISSLQNPTIKNMVSLLQKSRERMRQGLFVAEGFRELELALKNGFEAEALFYDETQTAIEKIESLSDLAIKAPGQIILVSPEVMGKIAYRSSVSNVVGLFKAVSKSFNDISLPSNPLILVSESVEKPGNLGAMLRTADAAGVSAVIVCDPQVDAFNPNTIRASLGAVFSIPIVGASQEETAFWLKTHHISILSTHLEASHSLFKTDLTRPVALVLGAESSGISEFWVQQSNERIIIPMSGSVDSLNVSAAAAILLFEAVRQRSLGNTD